MDDTEEPPGAESIAAMKEPTKMYPKVLKVQKPQKPKAASEYHLMEKKITDAIADFRAEKYPSLAEAGRAHGITKGAGYFRLRARASGRASKSDRIINGSQRLSPEQETALCRYIDTLDNTRALHRQIRDKAYSMMCENIPPNGSSPKPLGQQWPARFLERHPDILARRPSTATSTSSTNPDTDSNVQADDQEPTVARSTQETPQLLSDCQQFLSQSATGSEVSNATAEVSAVIPERDDQPSIDSAIKNSFFSAIKDSLSEHKMTFMSPRS